MGWSVRVFRKKNRINIQDLRQVINIFMSLGYCHCSISDNGRYYMLSVSKLVEEDIPWYLEDNSNDAIIYFNLVDSGEKIYSCPEELKDYYEYMFFEETSGRELMILDFLYEYFKLFPEDIFWNCDEYIYTKDDIEKLYAKKERDPNWLYYTDPKIL